jgi:hypothetical protein
VDCGVRFLLVEGTNDVERDWLGLYMRVIGFSREKVGEGVGLML